MKKEPQPGCAQSICAIKQRDMIERQCRIHITIIYLCAVAIGIYIGIHDHDAQLDCGYV